MARPFWFRPLRVIEKTSESIAKAAAHGEPLEMLLRKGVESVLEALNADRAGIWVEDAVGSAVWRGQVAQTENLRPRIEASDVNAFETFPAEFFEISFPLEFFAPVFPAGPREFFDSVSMAVGMPLKVDGNVFGALLAGSTSPGKLAGRAVVENIASEIAVSLYANRAREERGRMHRGLHLGEALASFAGVESGVDLDQYQLQSRLVQAEKMAAVGQLASGAAHELNNPLTSIMGYAQILLHKTGGRQEEARMIFDEAERARRIVRSLLFLARPEAPERTRVNVNEIVERTIGLRSYELKLHNIEVRRELDKHLPETFANPHQIQQLVLNLLVNAEQAVGENGGISVIRVRTRSVSADHLRIEISDSGPGVSPGIASRIFDPFFTTKPEGTGTGLGLAIVRSIAEQQGGKVWFENLPAGGAKFTAELAIVSVPEGADSRREKITVGGANRLPAARILVVEDEPTVAQLIADVLREDGHRVETVLDSQEALLRVMRTQYDLIICDLRMPRLDGPAFYDALVRARSKSRHRILFITGDTLGPHTLEFLQTHHLPYLAKPFLVEELKLSAYRALETSAGHSVEAHG